MRIDGVRQATVSTVAALQPQLADVQAELGALRGEVTRMHPPTQVSAMPVNWAVLSADDAEAVWQAMGRWVQEVLGDWCEVTRDQLPDCWALHRPALLQVSWLWTSHIEAHQPHSRPNAAAEWHTRWLDAALERISRVIPVSRCRSVAGQPGQHLLDRLDTHHHSRHRSRPASAVLTSQAGWAPEAMHSVAGVPAARSVSNLGQQVIHAPFWQPYFRHAMQADLAQRRRREAGQEPTPSSVVGEQRAR